MRARRRGGDRGSVSLELVGMLPVLALAVALTFEVAATLWTVTATDQAVRAAARAYSLDGTGAAGVAARDSLPGPMKDQVVVATGGDTVRVEVTVPGLSVLPDHTVTRELVMP
ncbi:hypothetical protein [Aquipuribacter hungaricus]|uniref:Pilus assembly protein n=1 Tax=Aquipuribacter hungaricus TaxID=545624 RepID=A0ABV7WIP6_9MICO